MYKTRPLAQLEKAALVAKAVEEVTLVPLERLRGGGKRGPVDQARHLAYLLLDKRGLSMSATADYLHRTSHTSVRHAKSRERSDEFNALLARCETTYLRLASWD